MSAWASVISAIVGAALGAFATVASGAFGYFNKDRELDIRMVDIGLSILSGENKGVDAEPGRRFALRLLQKYAETSIPEDEFDLWVRRGTLEIPLLKPALDERQALGDSIAALDARARELRFALGRQSQGVDGLSGRGPEYFELRQKIVAILKEADDLRRRMTAIDELIKTLEPQPAKN